MEGRALKRIEEVFCILLQDASLTRFRERNKDHIRLGRSYGRNNAVLGWNSGPIQSVVKEISKVCPYVAQATIAKIVGDKVVEIFEKEVIRDDADPALEAPLGSIYHLLENVDFHQEMVQLVQDLQSRVGKFTVFVGIDGIELQLPRLVIGEVTLYTSNHGPLIEILENLPADHILTEDVKRAAKAVQSSSCYAATIVEGDEQFARQQALEKVQDAVYILNLYLAWCRQNLETYQKIGISGQTPQRDRLVTLHLMDGATFPGFHGKSYPMRYKIGSKELMWCQETGWDRVIECFSRDGDERGSIKPRIRRAVTWYSKGVNADTLEEQFVALISALESLLVGDGRGSITQRLAERVAFLLGRTYDERIELESRVKRLYRMRSETVHQGEPVSLENLIWLDGIVKGSIFAFIQRGFGDWTAFEEWEKHQKFDTVWKPGDDHPTTA